MNGHSHHSRKQILFALKLGAVMIGGALLLALARHQGWIEAGRVARVNNVIIGLALAAYGNVMPKMMYGRPLHSASHASLQQAIARVSGWAMTLAFLAWSALWAFAPPEVARIGAMAAVGAGVAVMLGYAAWKCVTWQPSKSD